MAKADVGWVQGDWDCFSIPLDHKVSIMDQEKIWQLEIST